MPSDGEQGGATAGGEQAQGKPELAVSFFEFGCVRAQEGHQRWRRARPKCGQKPTREGAQSRGLLLAPKVCAGGTPGHHERTIVLGRLSGAEEERV